MTPELWHRIKQVFDDALNRDEESRGAYVAAACGDDSELRRAVEELLARHNRAATFLEPPSDEWQTAIPPMVCPDCGACADASQRFCLHDGSVLVDDPEAMVGRTIADLYTIEAVLGRGGMGTVYRARHVLLRDVVAIKVLPAGVRDNAAWLQRFLREGQAARRLRHPNAVAVFDLRADNDGLVFMVMEYVEGVSLRSEMKRRRRFTAAEALDVLEPISRALDAAHAAGIVHRDMKPENVVLGEDAGGERVVKVLDLGIAKLREIGSSDGATPANPTEPGVLLGTPKDMSPEQWGEPQSDGISDVDGRADVYALGVMAFEMVTGRHPFDGVTSHELWRQHISANVPDPCAFASGLSPEFGRALVSALSKDRANRPPGPGSFVSRLRDVLDGAETERLPRPTSEVGGLGTKVGANARHVAPEMMVPPATEPEAPPTEAVSAPVMRARRARPVGLAVAGLVAIMSVALAWKLWPAAQPHFEAVPVPIVAPVPPPVEIVRYTLEVEGRDATPAPDALPGVSENQGFRIRFRSREAAHLYIVAPDEDEVPTAFLTSSPRPETHVTTNILEPSQEFSFPSPPVWLGIRGAAPQTVYTIVLSPEPLSDPAFLTKPAGARLSAADREQLRALRERLQVHGLEQRYDGSGYEIVSAPANREPGPVVFEVLVRHQ